MNIKEQLNYYFANTTEEERKAIIKRMHEQIDENSAVLVEKYIDRINKLKQQ